MSNQRFGDKTNDKEICVGEKIQDESIVIYSQRYIVMRSLDFVLSSAAYKSILLCTQLFKLYICLLGKRGKYLRRRTRKSGRKLAQQQNKEY